VLVAFAGTGSNDPIDWPAVAALATVALAVVTTVLAGATYWLGRKTREVAVETARLAKTTDEEMQLLRDQTAALRASAETGAEQLKELRESRFAELVPMLRWQSPSPRFNEVAGPTWILGVIVFLTNEGTGPARIREAQISADTREDFEVIGVAIPSTLPAGERIAFEVSRRTSVLERRPRVLTIRLRYGDLLGEFEYETVSRIRVSFEEPGMSAEFIDSDERSALERRVPK
jgi:hypothetical protein